ncbi:MAG: cytochrome P450 [Deltaproteobacteria bacterium]|nr:cytochrome P450 [Deltaproteobacteria bacterium]
MDVDCNFVRSDSWAGPEIAERMKWMRENEPVFWSNESGLWIIAGYRDLERISKNQDVFTSEFGIRPGSDVMAGLIDEGEPRHGILRSMINRGFTPRMVRKLEITFRQITTEAIDAIADKGECDFVESISVPLPILLIAEMIGIHKEDQKRFADWSDDLVASDGNYDNPEIMAKATEAFIAYGRYVTELIQDKRENPQDDLMSILIGAKDAGLLEKEFLNDEIIDHQSVEHTELANDELIMLLQILIENPSERRKLLDDPSLLPSAVEEMVRLVSPVRTMGRTLTRDFELNGKQLKKGQEVCLVYPSANRDSEVYEDAETFRVDRNPQHLGFGIGSHFCLGANLARMEMRVAFEETLRRLPDMEYSRGGPEFRPSSLVRSCSHMWVRYTPEH